MYKLISGKNRRGVWIKEYEMEMLYLLYNQGLLTTKQLYSYVENKAAPHYNSFLKRLVRFAKMNLIVEHQYSLGQDGFYFKYYRIGPKGVQVLIDNNKLSNEITENLSRLSRMKNIDHYLSTQEIVMNGLIESEKRNLEIVSLNPYDFPYLVEEDESPLIIPDWILKKGELILNIELDTGREVNWILVEKVRKYIKVAKSNPNQKHIVFIAVLDDSFRSRFSYGKRMKRVGSLKQSISELNLETTNLEVYIVPFYRAKEISTKILFDEAPYDFDIRRREVVLAVHTLDTLNFSFPYEFQEQNIEEYYRGSLNKELQADGVYKVKQKEIGELRTFALIVLEEGNVKSISKLRYNNQLLKDNKFNKPVDKILAIYPYINQLENDILGSEYLQCLIGSTEMWGEEVNGEPTFYLQNTPYKREVCPFEG